MTSSSQLEPAVADRGPLAGRAAIVTGGTRGIGRAIALRLAALGADVAICGRDGARLSRVKNEIDAAGVRAFAGSADVTRAADVSAFAAAAESALGPVSILINNAGVGLFGPVHEKSEADWDRVLATNLKSIFLMARAIVPGMIRRQGGDIINISSLAGKNVFAGGGIYCASKWGVQGLSGCMAEDLREYGIRVSTICPGSVATEFSLGRPKDASKALRPEDVAHAVELMLTQGANSFLSEVHLRPLRKP